jgi:cell fate regulator YaaT (PSP1 superfamily)
MTKGLAIKLRKFYRICPITGYKEESIRVGAPIVVETDRGIEYGQIVSLLLEQIRRGPHDVRLKRVLRYATVEDVQQAQGLTSKEEEAMNLAVAKVKEYEQPVKLIGDEYMFDASRIIFYFSIGEGKKANLRELTRDLGSVLKTKVDMRQINSREVARLMGGLGPCGRLLCCASWLNDFPHVTVKMVKEQGITLSPTRTSGMCGRLLCCLKYEYEKNKGGKEKNE